MPVCCSLENTLPELEPGSTAELLCPLVPPLLELEEEDDEPPDGGASPQARSGRTERLQTTADRTRRRSTVSV